MLTGRCCETHHIVSTTVLTEPIYLLRAHVNQILIGRVLVEAANVEVGFAQLFCPRGCARRPVVLGPRAGVIVNRAPML